MTLGRGFPGELVRAERRARGSEKMFGGDLVDPDMNAEQMTAVIKKEAENLEGNRHKKGFTGTDEELAAIVDWLLEQTSG